MGSDYSNPTLSLVEFSISCENPDSPLVRRSIYLIERWFVGQCARSLGHRECRFTEVKITRLRAVDAR